MNHAPLVLQHNAPVGAMRQYAQSELCSHFLNASTEDRATPISFIAHFTAWLFVYAAYPDSPTVSTSHDVTPARTFLHAMVSVLIMRQEKQHVIFKLLMRSRPSCPKPELTPPFLPVQCPRWVFSPL